MMKRILALLLCGCILLPLAGCWDMREINDRVYVVGIGLDKSEKEGLYDFSFQVAVPIGSDKAMTTNDIDYTVTTVVTGSMAQAVRTLNKSVRDVNFEHLACIIIGESMMKEDFPSLLEYLYRWSVVRRQCVVVASDKPAKEMLSLEPDGGNMSLSLAQMMEQEDGSRNKSSTMTLLRLYQASSAMEGFSLYRIGVSQDGVISGYNNGGADTEESSSDAKSKGSVSIVVSGINVYDGGDFVGTLDSYEAEMSRLFYDGQSTGVITTDHVDGKRYIYQIESSRCVKSCEIVEDVPFFDIYLEVECSLVDSGAGYISQSSLPDEGVISAELYKQLSGIVENSLKEYGSAAIGLDDTVRQYCYPWYSRNKLQWREIYKKSKISLTVVCKLESEGSIR